MLKVCIMSADFWGLKSAGGTATAYHLLAAVLSKDKSIKVGPDQLHMHLNASKTFRYMHDRLLGTSRSYVCRTVGQPVHECDARR